MSEQPKKKSKERTSITIDPDLWGRCKKHCETVIINDKPMPLSELIDQALKEFLNTRGIQ